MVAAGADRRGKSRVELCADVDTAYRGSDEALQFLVEHGAKIGALTKAGDSVADMVNGPEALRNSASGSGGAGTKTRIAARG